MDIASTAQIPAVAVASLGEVTPMSDTPDATPPVFTDLNPTFRIPPNTIDSNDLAPSQAMSDENDTAAHFTPVLPVSAAADDASARPTEKASIRPANMAHAGSGAPPYADQGHSGDGRSPRPTAAFSSGKKYNPSRVITFGAVILVALALFWAVSTFFKPTSSPNITKPTISAPTTTETPTADQTATPPPPPALPAPVISNVTLINPQADTADEDSPSSVPNAWDGNPATSWRSWWYSNASFAGKDGVGLEIQLAAESNVSEVVLNVNGQGGNVQWFNTSAAAPTGGTLVAESAMSGETVLRAAEPLTTSTVIVWFNQLPVDGEGNNRVDLSEIQVR